MKKKYLLFLLPLIVCCKQANKQTDAAEQVVDQTAQPTTESPKAVMRVPLSVDMGEYFAGTEPKTEKLLLENVGNDTLRIFKIMPDCDCTEASVSDTIIAPGQSTSLFVSLDLSEFVPAEIEKQFVIFSNNDENQYVRVTLKGIRK